MDTGTYTKLSEFFYDSLPYIFITALFIPITESRSYQAKGDIFSYEKVDYSSAQIERPLTSHRRFPRGVPPPICEACRKTQYETPFYCRIQPNLPQCILITCPKICDDTGGDPSIAFHGPPAPPPRKLRPHPVYFPKINEKLLPKRPTSPPPLAQQGRGVSKISTRGRVMVRTSEEEVFTPYDPETCELFSPYLSRLSPRSKYIAYRPLKGNLQIKDIMEIAPRYGLQMAEIHHPEEWYDVEKSSILDSVSTYKLSKDQPRIYYAVGLNDKELQDEQSQKHGHFHYTGTKHPVSFDMLDPRVSARTDERCSVLTHGSGKDRQQHLISRLWNCNKNFGKSNEIVHGLFMYPSGSICNRRSLEDCNQLQIFNETIHVYDHYYSFVEVGQSVKRFFYKFADQRTWPEAVEFCASKGLKLLDVDPKWDDALNIVEIVEQFLYETNFNPLTIFWTSGKFAKSFQDGVFEWNSTKTKFKTHYLNEAPPFSFAWWDDQAVISNNPQLSRRLSMKEPCVAFAINPEDGADRPKINFKAWYCNYPMFFLCYDEVDRQSSILEHEPPKHEENDASSDACEPIKPRNPPSSQSPTELEDPFDPKTCRSKSPNVHRLTPNSKFIEYRPSEKSFSVEQIKGQCRKFGLVPAEMRTSEDWDVIVNSGISGTAANGDGIDADYFYMIGMDDSKEAGKLRYNEDNTELTFAMFNPEGNTDIEAKCSILQSVLVPNGRKRGLMMLHEHCAEGLNSNDKIAYGLCMFPRTWKCFTNSQEEIAAAADKNKVTTLIFLGVTSTRSIFFNPLQRNWADAVKVCQAAGLSLLDFDVKWNDGTTISNIFKERLVHDGDFFQLTPLWTSGKLRGLYKDETGQWETTKTNLNFTYKDNSGFRWLHHKSSNLSQIREGTVENGCVEVSFDDVQSHVRFRPDYCDIPKYFLCYRKAARRPKPPPENELGITTIETQSSGSDVGGIIGVVIGAENRSDDGIIGITIDAENRSNDEIIGVMVRPEGRGL